MGRNRFTVPSVDRVYLDDGDWIELKHELNNGESKKLEAAGLKPPQVVNGRVVSPIDWEVFEIERAIVFLTDWSFRDAADKPVKVSTDALKALNVEDFQAINQAIMKHVAEVATIKKQQALEREKMSSPTPIEKFSPKDDEANSEATS